ncbi:alpha/beta hydrolase [Myxococcus xanthus]|uniref:Alpha/beta fold hydrolase n=1 Tax=Myxococcus xanthus TaxID=34 RepID=A0A7Y4MUF4_MYXXA|nr:alpha/beta fold hydrolase [Myxococcus xanthus]NOJ81538.1 alpha/beta fold hydrolase [Myxococcus xanthus]NOJ89021.1 alpha/beta fold hydrolase [Myxococcus xanthus]
MALTPLCVSLAAAGYLVVNGHRIGQGLLHPPPIPVTRPPAEPALSPLEDVAFTTSDGVPLKGWYVPSRNRAAVVLVHGFADNRAQLLFEARTLAGAGYGVLLFDLRAHGESGGDTVTWGDRERRDVTAALDFISARPDVDPGRLGLFGFSMGGTTSLLVASEDARVKAVAAAGAYPALEADIYAGYGRWGAMSAEPVLWTLRRAGVTVDAVRPIDGMCRLGGRPLLLVNGDVDPDAPAKLQASLFQAACEPKSLWVVEGAGHGQYARVAPEEYARRLIQHFGAALQAPPQASSGGATQ